VDRINLTDAVQASLGGPGSYLVVCAFVKAVYGETVCTVERPSKAGVFQ
jgi:hypothetical protein